MCSGAMLVGPRSNSLPSRHLLCHEQHHSQVAFIYAAEQSAELGKHTCILAFVAPQDVVGCLSLREIRRFGRFCSVVEELVHRDFKGTGKFL